MMGQTEVFIGSSQHHLIKRGQGGDANPLNLVTLCGHGSVGCHGDLHGGLHTREKKQQIRKRLEEEPGQPRLQYLLETIGQGRLDKIYPKEPQEELFQS
jgi:hypothetical protein